MKKKLAIATAIGAAIALSLAVPLSASAHVTVSPNTASAGSYALLNVKVPNESATAVTTKLELSLPTDTPLSTVSYVPVAGWTAELVRTTLPTPVKVGENTITEAVTKVIWTAETGFEISAGQLQVFPLSIGPLPSVGSLTFPADQFYSDGTIVSWNESGSGAEHPAPVLYVNDAPAADHHGNDSADDGVSAAGQTGVDVLARGFGIAGLVIGAIGVTIAAVALRRKAS
ncbi:MAG: YcnI family protein [Microbacteriaceae bacterium]|nr:YcnI family protein [Microbacteriaceae bacterium]